MVTLFTGGATLTFPLYIAGSFQREIPPQIHVLSTLVLALSLALLTLSLRRGPGAPGAQEAPENPPPLR